MPILIITLLLSTTVGRDQTRISRCCWSWWLSTHPRIGRILGLQFWRFRTASINGSSWTWPIISTFLISINTLIEGAHVSATILPSWILVTINTGFSGKRRAHKRFAPQHDFICAEYRSNKIVKVRLNSLPIFFQHVIMQFDSLLKLCYGLCIILRVSLQGDHVLFESLDQISVFIFGPPINWEFIWGLKSLRHDGQVLFLNEKFQSLNTLGDRTFGIIPDSDGIILKSWGHSVLGRHLEHLSLFLS